MKVVVVDDSPIARAAIRSILESDTEIQVVAEVSDSRDALPSIARHRPNLVAIDLHMPNVAGLELISELMQVYPVPIVVITGSDDGNLALEAVNRGALEVTTKPDLFKTTAGEVFRARVRELARMPVIRRPRPAADDRNSAVSPPPSQPSPLPIEGVATEFRSSDVRPIEVLAIGASAGGPSAIVELLSGLPKRLPIPVLLVQHISSSFSESFLNYLSNCSPIPVAYASELTMLKPGHLLVAPPDRHLRAVSRLSASATRGIAVDNNLPSATALLTSVADVFGPRAAGVLLSGMGSDGASGLLEMRRRGALTIVQRSPAVDGMPRAALEHGAAAWCLSVAEIARMVSACAIGDEPGRRVR
ncbi:MAG: chemotaxis protein CheB [Myxococcota bacterium]